MTQFPHQKGIQKAMIIYSILIYEILLELVAVAGAGQTHYAST